jgi:hypothetical protein
MADTSKFVWTRQHMEVNEASMQHVATLLAAATSSGDNHARELALLSLQDCDDVPGYLSVLLELVMHASLTPDMRLLAVITFKNTVDRCWTRNVSVLGGQVMQSKVAEQVHIRARLLTMCNFADIKVNVYIANTVVLGVCVMNIVTRAFVHGVRV